MRLKRPVAAFAWGSCGLGGATCCSGNGVGMVLCTSTIGIPRLFLFIFLKTIARVATSVGYCTVQLYQEQVPDRLLALADSGTTSSYAASSFCCREVRLYNLLN